MAVETVEISVAALNYDREKKILLDALSEIEAMVHSRDEFMIGEPEFAMGWYFFTLSVSRGLIVKIANLQGNEFLKVKGKSTEKKFLNWLTARMKQVGYDVHLNLKSDMETSKYGLF